MPFIRQKAQEVAFFVLRIAIYVRRKELRERLERLSFQLIEEAQREDFEYSAKTTDTLLALIELGKSLYEIEPINAESAIRELKSLNSAIRQRAGFADLPNIGTLFSAPQDNKEIRQAHPEGIRQAHPEEVRQTIRQTIRQDVRQNVRQNSIDSANQGIQEKPEIKQKSDKTKEKTDLRQSGLLLRMHKTGNRQFYLKDVLAILPEVSERTIRYDLQRLCGQGLLEKVGTVGPSTYYVIK